MNKIFPYKPKLNSAGRLAKMFIHSKLTVLIILSALLFGLLALELTPRTYNPEIIVPVVTLAVSRPGSDAHEMLQHIVRPLEGLMASIPGVDHTYGMAVDDNALVTVRFKVNENEENSLVKVYNQINSNMDKNAFSCRKCSQDYKNVLWQYCCNRCQQRRQYFCCI